MGLGPPHRHLRSNQWSPCLQAAQPDPSRPVKDFLPNDKLCFMLDMRRLRVLHAVSAYGSVTAAASALGYTAPAVSQQLAALEREVGLPLTERAGRGITLTPAATLLVAHTDALLTQLDSAEADLAALRDQVAGGVALAAFPSVAATVVAAAWAALAGSAPRVPLGLEGLEPE